MFTSEQLQVCCWDKPLSVDLLHTPVQSLWLISHVCDSLLSWIPLFPKVTHILLTSCCVSALCSLGLPFTSINSRLQCRLQKVTLDRSKLVFSSVLDLPWTWETREDSSVFHMNVIDFSGWICVRHMQLDLWQWALH